MNIYDFKANDYLGNEVNLSKYQGQVVLVVNTATRCGFTPQYEGLEALYEKYRDQGFVILDFPCNQFLAQAHNLKRLKLMVKMPILYSFI